MNKLIAFAALLAIAPFNTGCNQPIAPAPTAAAANPSAGIAIIDLDEVARQLGSDKQIVNAIKQREAVLNGKLGELAKNYTAEFKKQKDAIEAQAAQQQATQPQEPQPASGVQLATFQRQVNQNFSTAKAQAQQNLTQHRSKLINQFREAVRPAARKVAQGRGLSVIVTKQDSLVYDFAPECDITNDVVKMLRASATKNNEQQKPVEKS